MLKSRSVSWTKAAICFFYKRQMPRRSTRFNSRREKPGTPRSTGLPRKSGADAMKKGDVEVLAFPDFFPNQGGLPIQVDGQTLGGIAASGAKSEIDEAIAQAALDALFKK